MRRDADTGVIYLSERNLRALLSKLGREDSARTLIGGSRAEGVIVVAEHDGEHYGDISAGEVVEQDDPGRSDGGPIVH